jgi:hypothetical protein
MRSMHTCVRPCVDTCEQLGAHMTALCDTQGIRQHRLVRCVMRHVISVTRRDQRRQQQRRVMQLHLHLLQMGPLLLPPVAACVSAAKQLLTAHSGHEKERQPDLPHWQGLQGAPRQSPPVAAAPATKSRCRCWQRLLQLPLLLLLQLAQRRC